MGICCLQITTLMDDDTKREFEHLRTERDFMRERLESIIASNDQRYKSIEESQNKALTVALAAAEKRLEALHVFRDAMADQSNRMVPRAEAEAARTALAERSEVNRVYLENRIESEIQPLTQKVETLSKPNYAVLLSFVSALFVLAAGVWIVIGLKIGDTLSPVQLVLDQVRVRQASDGEKISVLEASTGNSTQADVASKTDRSQLNERMKALEAIVQTGQGERRLQASVMEARLTEIETQFCASDIVRNLMHANDLRMFSMLWKGVFPHAEYPIQNAFYPKVCNRGAIAQGGGSGG
jgi:hypothetical protein